MSDCAGFSTCRIVFKSNDQKHADQNYSDRSVIELRQYDFANYTIRALDIDHGKEIIFEIPLENADQYKRGKSSAQPDEVRANGGTYCLWLNAASRTKFHEALNASIEEIKLFIPESSELLTTSPDVTSGRDSRLDYEEPKPNIQNNYYESKSKPQPDYHEPKPKPKPQSDYHESKPTTQSNRNDILADVYQLGQYIRQGNTADAVNLAKTLSKARVRLQGKLRQHQNEEEPIQIRVKIDSNDKRINRQYANDLTMDVYPSTTIRELRTTFEYLRDFPPSNQYFFVNGHLAHENSNMNELDIRPNSLFVLFVIQQ